MQSALSRLTVQSADPALRAMFEARKRVFVDLLKWEVPVLARRYEIDQFDNRDAAYLVLAGMMGSHRGSLRLLRTEGPHILADLFPALCERSVPRSLHGREITRFCIDPNLARSERRKVRNQLVTALVDHALSAGLQFYTAVANLAWFRQIERFGWNCKALGLPQEVAGVPLVALQIKIDRSTRPALAANGIYLQGNFHLIEGIGAPQ